MQDIIGLGAKNALHPQRAGVLSIFIIHNSKYGSVSDKYFYTIVSNMMLVSKGCLTPLIPDCSALRAHAILKFFCGKGLLLMFLTSGS